MPGLGETTAALARLRRHSASGAPPASPRSLVEVAEFGANPGELRMRVHAPLDLVGGRPLVLVLHGCTQTAEHYAQGAGWIELSDRLGFAIVCPEQSTSNNPNRCFNWFEPGDIRRGQGEAASIRNMIDAALVRFGSDSEQVFVTGLSAGGAMASVMLAAYPEVFAGGGIIAGLPYGVAAGVPQAFAAMFKDGSEPTAKLGALVRQATSHTGPWPRVSVWHGDADTTVRPSNADAIVRQWLDVHGLAPTTVVQDNGSGHHVWRRDGINIVESRLIAGMGHGTPLAIRGQDGVGKAGPFLLDVGICSSCELARFWDITVCERIAKLSSLGAIPAPEKPPPQTADEEAQARTKSLDAANDEQGIRAIINRALRAAGLVK